MWWALAVPSTNPDVELASQGTAILSQEAPSQGPGGLKPCFHQAGGKTNTFGGPGSLT